MSTTFYCPSTGTAPISPSDHSSWDRTGSSFSRKLGVKTAISSSMTTVSIGTTSSASQTSSAYQWVYGPLEGASISGTCSCDVRGKATTFINLFFARVAIWIAKPDGTSRGTLYSPNSSHNNSDWSTSFSTYNSNVSLSSVTATSGDYLVYEVGQCREAFVDSDSSAVEIGDSNSGTRMEFVFSSNSINFWAPAGLSYSNDNQKIRLGNAITAMAASSTGGPIASYAIQTGALPSGVTLNTSTGEITGTPTQKGIYTFTVRATNEGGTTDTSTLTITVYSGNSIRYDRLTSIEVQIGG